MEPMTPEHNAAPVETLLRAATAMADAVVAYQRARNDREDYYGGDERRLLVLQEAVNEARRSMNAAVFPLRATIDQALASSEPAAGEKSVRREALLQAARDVCGYCGGRFYPSDPGIREIHGPNAAGNYTHHGRDRAEGSLDKLCVASAVYARIRFEETA